MLEYQPQRTAQPGATGKEGEKRAGQEMGFRQDWGVEKLRKMGLPMGKKAAQTSPRCPGAALLGAAHLRLRFIM